MDKPDYDRELSVSVGEAFTVTLRENATTGYRWAVDHFDPEAIEQLGAAADYPTEQRVGAAGEVAFSFRARRAGAFDVSFKHWRHFSGDKSIIQRYTAHVVVKP